MSRGGPWQVLGIDPTDDLKDIRRAYADRLKAMDIDQQPAEYAALRRARDTALSLAKSGLAVGAPDEEEDKFEWSVFGGHHEDRSPAEISPAEDEPLQEELPAAPAGLEKLLFPGDEYSDQPFTYDEWEQADAHLQAIVAEMLEGDVTRQQMIDMWVADRLARAWPRSSMLLERASAAFGWESGRGQLDEGPAQTFLNARLSGMRFHAAVQDPGHWAHKAWTELSSSGTKGMRGRFRARKDDVAKLLGGIREHFPELESYLDEGKVRSWDTPVDNPWSVVGPIVFGLILLAQALRFCSSAIPDAEDLSSRQAPEMVWTERMREELVEELFGRGTSFAEVQFAAPPLAGLISQAAEPGTYAGDRNLQERTLASVVRAMILLSDQQAEFEQLIKIKQLKLSLAAAAEDERGAAGCAIVLESSSVPDVVIPRTVRDKERVLAKELMAAGLFETEPAGRPSSRAPIPGEIFAAAERASGISGEVAKRATIGEGAERDRCAFRKALINEVLRQPGRVSAELLRIL